ncbi:sulfotransferase domain-containing protein [Tautonia rosea]|uniref:sulfotransferase domain-containing protein n=1 Tax=Tautonia rosea TaxID=2728037 RepID=UPI001472E364|nr:sulfotransferase domain-containing protein [Tautonia rosea]
MNRQFVSYPKSGRTWIRFLLTQLDLDPQIVFHHDRFEFNDGARPPHDFDLERRLRDYAQVDRLVYLERDPRDTIVSLYHQVTGRFRDFFAYEGTLSDFVRDDYFGAETLHRFRVMWAELADRLGVLRVSYEQCHEDLEGTVRRILDYYGFEVSPDRLAKAVQLADFDSMKRLEQSGTFAQPWLRPRNGAPKVRRGTVGGFRDALGPDDIAYLNTIFFTRAAA